MLLLLTNLTFKHIVPNYRFYSTKVAIQKFLLFEEHRTGKIINPIPALEL